MRLFKQLFFSIILISYSLTGLSADADTPSVTPKAISQLEIKPDKHNRRTPNGTVDGFLEAVAQDDLDRAIAYLNLSFITKADHERRGKLLAKRFEALLSSSGKLEAGVLISEYLDGNTEDGLDLNLDRIGTIFIDDKEIPVLLEQVKDADELPIWLFSAETLKNIPLKEVSSQKLIDINNYVPSFLQDNKFIGVSFGHWLMILVMILLSFLIARIILISIVNLIQRFAAKYLTEQLSVLLIAMQIPARLWLSVYLFVNSLQYLSVPILLRQHFNSIAVGVYLVAFLILIWQITNIAHIVFTEKFKKFDNTGVVSILHFVKRSIRFILVVVGILVGLHLYDHNVTAGLAALGIGGLALALGAQKTLENIAGSINVVADQAVNIGDYCKFNEYIGRVEEIGIRSTKIRTLTGTLLTIPNAEFSSHIIENFTKREGYKFFHKIGIRYETSPDQIRYLIVKLQELLYAHPKIDKNKWLFAKLSEFGDACLIIDIWAYIMAKSYTEYMQVKEDLNLRIIDIVHQSGTSFAFPSQTIYLSKDHGLSESLTTRAETTVENWRSDNALDIPNFPEGKIQELNSTLSYPDKGSSLSSPETDRTFAT